MRRIIIIVIVIALVGVVGFFGYRRYQNVQAANQTYQTVKVTRGDLTASVGATGTVRAKQSVIVNWQTTGNVADVKVKEGQLVKKGQELATLDGLSVPQNVILAQADLITAQRNLDQLINSDTARAQAQQTLVQAQKDLDTANTQRESKQYARASDATVAEARSNYVLAQDNVKKYLAEYDKVDSLPEDSPIRASAYSQLAGAQKKEDTALANLNYLLGKPDNMEIAQADAAVTIAEAKLKDAQREYARLQNGADPQDITAAKTHIAALQAILGMVNLNAPIDGTVTDVNLQPGDNAVPGVQALRIDDLSQLQVDVQITEVDIDQIKVGQPAMMTFDAITDHQYIGKVTQVSSVGLNQQGVVNFLVTVTLNDSDNKVHPGMTAAVNIVTDLVQNALIVPNRAVRIYQNNRVVWVLRNGVPEMTEIQLGRLADTNSQVISGDVSEGDLLVLNPPTSAFGQNNFPAGRPGGGGGSTTGGN